MMPSQIQQAPPSDFLVTATGSTTARALATRFAEVTNVKDFGAVGDGATDDKTAIQAAIDALSFGGIVFFPQGTYKVSGALTVAAGVVLVGEQGYVSVISTSSATVDILDLTTSSKVFDLKLTSSVARTAGNHIDAQGNGITIERVEFENYYIGVTVGTVGGTQAVQPRIINCSFSSPDIAAGCGGIQLMNFSNAVVYGIVMTGPSPGTQPDFGIRIRNGDTGFISDTNITLHGKALLMDPESGSNCFAFHISNSLFDSAGAITGPTNVASAEILPAGGVYDTLIVNCWFGLSTSAEGLNVGTSGAGAVDGLMLANCEFVGNGTYGLLVNGAGVLNVTVLGGLSAGNTNYGLYFGNATTYFTVKGHRAGNVARRGANDYGIVVESAEASDFYLIEGCHVVGNTTVGIFDGGTGTNKIIRDNLGYVTENSGTGTINSAATTATITHGLAKTPAAADIWITFTEQATNDYGRWWISGITSTQFVLNVSADPGASNLDFSWGARIK